MWLWTSFTIFLLGIFLSGHGVFWQFSSMAVSTKICFINFRLLPWPTDGNFSCKNHIRCFWQFSCMALNFFDNFTVWPWPYKFIWKKLDNFPVWFFDNFPVWIFDNFPVHVFDNFPVPRSRVPRLKNFKFWLELVLPDRDLAML